MQFITLLDYFLLPFYLLLIYLVAIIFRERRYPVGHPWRKYFLPGLTVKIGGAIFIGMIYQYYYGGGDTSNYFEHAQVVNTAFGESIPKWLNLVSGTPKWYDQEYSDYISQLLPWYESPAEYAIVSIAALLGIVTFTTYLPIAVLFGVISFTGMWALFRTFALKYPAYLKYIAICTLYIPSTIMWGSGIFKDTICMFGLGWMTYGAFRILIHRDLSAKNILLTMISFYLVAVIKVYILLAFLPALALWILFTYSHSIASSSMRVFVKAFIVIVSVGGMMYFSDKLSSSLGKYSLQNVAETSLVTRTYINSVSGDEGSGYTLGDFDPSFMGMMKKLPLAVNVSLFRPYIWETRKPIQLLNAVEAMMFMWVTIKVLITVGLARTWRTIKADPTIQFCLIFTIVFAFAVGISSYNFGALSRYRIPCLPFYGLALVLIYYKNQPIVKNILSLKL
jgi:hypothetical protein